MSIERVITDTEKERILRLRNANRTLREISELTGIGVRKLSITLRKCGENKDLRRRQPPQPKPWK